MLSLAILDLCQKAHLSLPTKFLILSLVLDLQPQVADVSSGSYDDCNQYDDTMCGFEYSNSGQAAYCAVPQPSSWPALMQVMPVLNLLCCFCPWI